MSDFDTARDLPNNYDAYSNWINGWIFGLPDDDHPQSDECGAMPFRYGKPQNSVNAQKCLRGEDWAFLNSFCNSYQNMPSPLCWSRSNYSVPQLNSTPYKLEVERMYDYLSSFEQARCWGTGIKLSAGTGYRCTEDTIYSTVADQLSGHMHIQSSPPLATQPLSMNQMKDFFRDTQKFRCTIADAGYRFTNGSRTVWMWDDYVPEAHMPPEIETSDISSVYFAQSYGPRTQKVRAIGQAIMGVEVQVDQNGDYNEYFAVVVVGEPFEMTTSQ